MKAIMDTIAASFSSRKLSRPAPHVAAAEPRLRALATAIARDEHADFDDLYQVGFEVALRRIATFNPAKGGFYPYIYRAAREAMYACARERGPHDELADEPSTDLADVTTPEDLVLQADPCRGRAAGWCGVRPGAVSVLGGDGGFEEAVASVGVNGG